MSDDITGQCVLFPGLFSKPVRAQFDERDGSCDGGAILLKACDAALNLSRRLAECLVDRRQAGKVEHSVRDLLRQRLFGIACGYEDGNDAARLAADPIHRLLLERDALTGAMLASQPTLSRFENAARRAELYRMGEALAECVIERHQRRLGRRCKHITIDLDPTDDPTHGAQQLTFFNGHYDSWCYLPVAGFLTFNHEPEQYLFSYVLRPGNAPATRGAVGLLRRLLERARAAFPRARILVRLDGGFAASELFDFLERERCDYVVAMAKNKRLAPRAARLMGTARRLSRRSGKTAHVYGQTHYAARRWKVKRRVIIKAEVVRHPGREPKMNPRFVVTNLKGPPRRLYERVYCARGDIENRIKELHHGLAIDRTSCPRFFANQFRVLLTAAAYVLMQELRRRAAGTSLARAQVSTLRERLLKLGARIERSVRRIVVHLPHTAPYQSEWRRVALAVGAVPA